MKIDVRPGLSRNELARAILDAMENGGPYHQWPEVTREQMIDAMGDPLLDRYGMDGGMMLVGGNNVYECQVYHYDDEKLENERIIEVRYR